MAVRRILFIDQAGEIGGAELSLLDIARHHREEGHVFLFDDGPFKQCLEQSGVSVTVLPVGKDVLAISRDDGFWGALKVIPRLTWLALTVAIKARRYEIIYANSQKAFVVSALASWICRRPLIWHLRDMLTASHFSPAMRGVAVWFANRRAHCVIANSRATANAFARAGGLCNTVVIHNGIDPTPFQNVESSKAGAELRARIGSGDSPVVGIFSRLAFWKGQHVAIRAARKLPGVHVVLVGAALFGEQHYEDELHQAAERAGVGRRIHFLGFQNDVPALLSGVDIVLHTSIAPEPFGRVIVEGMLAQKPVIATAAGGALEIVEDGVTGLLVPPDDASALADAVRSLLESPDRGGDLARRGCLEAMRKFSLKRSLSAIDETIENVISTPFSSTGSFSKKNVHECVKSSRQETP
jgi:glycosyltransferase involved in cell wall biosynthesis